MEKIRRLIFEGGGVKGIGYVGALEELEKHIDIKHIKQFGGSSAGAFTALLLALDYDIKQIKEICIKTNFNRFADRNIGIIRNAYRLIKRYGISRGDYLLRVLRQLILLQTSNTDTTFLELYKLKGNELAITGTNITRHGTTEYFHYLTTPDIAVLISMSYPIVFKAVKYNDYLYVDGGLLENYPFDIFWKIYNNVPKTSTSSSTLLISKNDSEIIIKDNKINEADMVKLGILYKNPACIFNQTYETYIEQTLGFRVDSTQEINERLTNVKEEVPINNIIS